MNEDFKFFKLSSKHKKMFMLYQILLFSVILLMGYLAVLKTNPTIVETNDQISLTMGAVIGLFVVVLAMFNRLKNLLKVKFIAFLIVWILLYSMQMIMTTLIWGIGLCLIPLMIDDLILVPIWKNLWYNNYER